MAGLLHGKGSRGNRIVVRHTHGHRVVGAGHNSTLRSIPYNRIATRALSKTHGHIAGGVTRYGRAVTKALCLSPFGCRKRHLSLHRYCHQQYQCCSKKLFHTCFCFNLCAAKVLLFFDICKFVKYILHFFTKFNEKTEKNVIGITL